MENILIGIKRILPTIDRRKISPPTAVIINSKDYKPRVAKGGYPRQIITTHFNES